MPYYDLLCGNCGRTETKTLSFDQYDRGDFPVCICGDMARPVAANKVTAYGTMKLQERTFREASIAAGQKITSTKEIDLLEKTGKMYPITNPSQYHFKNGKKIDLRSQKEKLRKALDNVT